MALARMIESTRTNGRAGGDKPYKTVTISKSSCAKLTKVIQETSNPVPNNI